MPDDLHPAGTTPHGDEAATETGAPQVQDQSETQSNTADGATDQAAAPAKKTTARKTAAKRAPAKKAPAKKAAKKATTVSVEDEPLPGAEDAGAQQATEPAEPAEQGEAAAPAKKTAAKRAPAKKAAAKSTAAKKTTTRKTAAKKAVATPAEEPAAQPDSLVDALVDEELDEATAAAAAAAATAATTTDEAAEPGTEPAAPMLLFKAPETAKAPAKRTRKAPAAKARPEAVEDTDQPEATQPEAAGETRPADGEKAEDGKAAGEKAQDRPTRSRNRRGPKTEDQAQDAGGAQPADSATAESAEADSESQTAAESAEAEETEGGGGRRRRRRGGRRRRKPGDGESGDSNQDASANGSDEDESAAEGEGDQDEAGGENAGEGGSSRRRRRRRRTGDDSGDGGDDPQNTVTRVRKQRSAEDEITAVSGSTRLEAKKQRRREGREAGRRRAPIVSEAEFLARREAVDRVMVIRQHDELTQIGVLEDKVLVEHYVARESQTSLIGNVYLGRVQNVLPSMEAAFIDIGKGRNAVLYAGEVNWSALGHRDGQPRKIESVLTSGQPILVQVTKDPIGHKGARLTSQISLAGRFLVYVPDGTTSGISRKLPDTERNRLKTLLKEIVPDSAGVIVRTAAEGASEDELTHDVERLKARWEDIERKTKGSAPQLLYGEPDLTLKVVRDLFTEDFSKLVIQGDDAWDTVQGYVSHVAPDLEQRLERFEQDGSGKDIFATYRIDEQIAKGLDRKVWLPSGGSLVIDRTEAMTVVDVNTGKFTGSGGNLEETVTKNNLEAAEEIVRQLRLRDIGGIIVVDFIDMVLESNRDLVLRRLVECLGRDRTRHQVAEVTSLGLVQMTRKRIGTGLVESFSENCEHCQGRGVVIKDAPVEPKKLEEDARRGSRRSRGGRGRDDGDGGHQHDTGNGQAAKAAPSPKDIAAVAKPENAEKAADQATEEQPTDGQQRQERPAKVQAAKEQPAAAVTPEPSAEVTPVEATQPEPVEPAAPKVVTRTRRRAASRPAGQPEHQTAAPQPVVVETPVAAEPAAPEPVAPAEPPKVVTRTRGRSASRPAGPPSGAAADEGSAPVAGDGGVPAMVSATAIPAGSSGSVGAPPAHGVVEPGTAAAEPGPDSDAHAAEEHHVEHVPIKKKGSRKR